MFPTITGDFTHGFESHYWKKKHQAGIKDMQQTQDQE